MVLRHICLCASLLSSLAVAASAQSDLQVIFGTNGLERVTYKGTLLDDINGYPGDTFHIGHMKVTDMSGNSLLSGQSSWGEINNGRSWNAGDRTWTYSFDWGSISLQYVVNGNSLDMNVTARNYSGSGVIFNGAVIYPLTLHFPQLPVGFVDSTYEQLAFNTTGPSVTLADFGAGEVASVLTDATRPLYTGFEPAGPLFTYYPIISGTGLDNMATFFPRNERPVRPGEVDSFTVSLRFAPSGTPASDLAADAYRNWAQAWPQTLTWNDRRIIGTAYLASAGSGLSTLSAGFFNNPRRYFNNGDPAQFDIRSADGLTRFQSRVLAQASSIAANASRMNSQGVITWDIEGQEFPHSTSYACSPDQIARIAPEMETVVADSSPYNGMKLDDAYFKIQRDAGLRIGICVRPQHFTLYGNGAADQVFLPAGQVFSELAGKIRYAHDRWGATLFYVDSSVDENGGALDPSIFQQLAAAFPDSLIMPEWSTPKYYAFTAPFQTFIFHTDLGTPKEIYNYYSRAFTVNLINDVDGGKLASYRSQLTESVRRGDILLLHADYWQENNDTAVQIYRDAGFAAAPEPSTPVPPTPTPVEPAPAAPAPVPADPAPAPAAPQPDPIPAPPQVSKPSVQITNITEGATLSNWFTVKTNVTTAAGTLYLFVDGAFAAGSYVVGDIYVFDVDTRLFSNGSHSLQVWVPLANDNSVQSEPLSVTVQN